jgi:hypothetical protein
MGLGIGENASPTLILTVISSHPLLLHFPGSRMLRVTFSDLP